jgi:hypothetical protein
MRLKAAVARADVIGDIEGVCQASAADFLHAYAQGNPPTALSQLALNLFRRVFGQGNHVQPPK